MKKTAVCLVILYLITAGIGISKYSIRDVSNTEHQNEIYNITMKRDIMSVMMGYPGYITGIEKADNGRVFLITKSGRKLLYDDKRVKDSDEKINNPDIQDMMEQIYPLNDIASLMKEDYDPGRARYYSLLKEVYGVTREGIESNLVSVNVGDRRCRFNKNNNAANELSSAMKELSEIGRNNKNINRYLFPTNGTYNYRYISGTNRLSAHAFGIAIDLASDKRDYWKWAKRSEGEARLASYSREVVRTFEKHNFIWGGKWGHFDILHFEYRPEIIYKARYFNKSVNVDNVWYAGVPIDNQVKKCIELIDGELE